MLQQVSDFELELMKIIWENGGTGKQAGQYLLPLPQMLSCEHGEDICLQCG